MDKEQTVGSVPEEWEWHDSANFPVMEQQLDLFQCQSPKDKLPEC